MKRITYVFVLLLSLTAHGQLPLESFEGAWSPVPAATGTETDWLTLDNNNGTTVTWSQGEHSDATPSYEGLPGTHAAYLDLEDVTSGTAIDYLITPEFTMPMNGQLRFRSRLTITGNQGSQYKIKILPENASAANTANYIDLVTWTEGQINPVQTNYYEKTVVVPEEYYGSIVRIAFVMQGDNMDRWLIDNISVTAPCLPPNNLDAVVSTIGEANLSWTHPGGASQWEIEIIPVNASPSGHGLIHNGSLTYNAIGTATGSPLVQESFAEHTDYKFFVRAICDDTGVSNWVGPFDFMTLGLGDNCTIPLEFSTLPFSNVNDTENFSPGPLGSPGQNCNQIPVIGYSAYSVSYRYVAELTGNIRIDLKDAGPFAALFIYDECEDVLVNCMEGAYKWYNEPAELALESFPVIEGEDYYFVVRSSAMQTLENEFTHYELIVQALGCDTPLGNHPTNIQTDSAIVSWIETGEATEWQVEVQEAFSGMPAGDGSYTTTTNSGFEITGLTAGTHYEYFVRASCGDGHFSAWAGP